LEEELEFVRAEVQMGGQLKRRGGLFGRVTPARVPPAPKRPSTPPPNAAERGEAPGDEDVDAVVERRLFGE
jgi:hypothetical protein